MDVRICIWTLILTQRKSHSLSIFGEISKDITFLHKVFPVPPSTRAIIEVDVSYPINSIGNPFMGIYTTLDHINIRKQCTYIRYGQLANANLHPRIRLDESDIESTKCLKEGLDTIRCMGNITVQDFKPRKISFSFGFYCDRITLNRSLKGLAYNISIHQQTNSTKCIVLPSWGRSLCSQFYQHGLLPDLIGADVLTVLRKSDLFKIYINIFEAQCYQHSSELGCYIIVPECDLQTRQVIHPCREMCHDWRTACSKITLQKSRVSMKIPNISSDETTVTMDITSMHIDCDYLPSLNGDIPCFYKPVLCQSPPLVKAATIVSIKFEKKDTYSVFDTVEYSCEEGFKLIGSKTVTCHYKGRWSTPPKCSLKSNNRSRLLLVILPILLILLILMLLIGACKYRIKRQIKNKASTRNKQYDAFVCYCYEGQDPDFAEKIVPEELEEKYGLKLCIHRRDFKAGWDIKWNIMNAIRNSNSAIIIMSQDYINSLWCVEEFEDCYMENMKDPAFKMFVALMQPADTLEITNEYIQSFFAKKTYLERDDPKLFKKIAEYLIQVKQIQKAPEGASGEAMNPLLENHAQNEAQKGYELMMEKDEEIIELKQLNNLMDMDADHLHDDDDDDDDEEINHHLLENREISTILENKKNYEIMETRVEVHNDEVGGIGSVQEYKQKVHSANVGDKSTPNIENAEDEAGNKSKDLQ